MEAKIIANRLTLTQPDAVFPLVVVEYTNGEFLYTIQVKTDIKTTLDIMSKLRVLQSSILFYQNKVTPDLTLRFACVDFNRQYETKDSD